MGGGEVEGVGVLLAEEGEGVGIGDEVDLVEDGDGAFVFGSEVCEDFEGGVVVAFDVFGGGVEDVDEEVGEDGFFEGGFEGFDEAVGEVSNKSDGVGDEEGLAVWEFDAAGGGVEGGEEHVFGHDVRAGELVEEGGFSGVGVADDGGVRGFVFFAVLALGFALFADFLEFAFAAVDAEVCEAAVDFDLFFAHAAGCAAAGAATGACGFAVEVAPHAGEAREGVLHACEFDLEACFLGLCAASEDIEDDFLAVDDGEVGEFFPFALLGGSEAVVDDDDVAFVGACEFDDFGGFAGAAEEFFVHFAAACEDEFDDVDAEGFDEFAEFL